MRDLHFAYADSGPRPPKAGAWFCGTSAMRLDKFLKVSRLAKRRAEAKDGIEAGRITKEGRALKPGYEVKAGDVLVLHYRTKFLTVRVLLVPERVLPSLKPADLYEIVEERKDDPVEWLR
jgi:ribosomal 50S subunit-recycling heat shock protein